MHTYLLQTVRVIDTAAGVWAVNNTNKKAIFKSCVPFTDCITEINNAQVNDTQKIDIVMFMYKLLKYVDGYSKTSGSLWQY